MYNRQKSFFWGPVLTALSWAYGAVIGMRQALYTLHVLQRKRLHCAVISVGNITLGGTGKTPTVINIAGLLGEKQRHPVVVSRGYGRKNESEMLLVSDGRSMLVDSQTGGDEPVLIGTKLPGVPVVVGSNRFQAAQDALNRFPLDVVLLDDGFQHIQLKRTLDIVLIDAGDPFGNGKLFPAGILREPLTALKRAHAVVIAKTGITEDAARLKEIISAKTRARIFTSRLIPLDVVDCSSGASSPLSSLQGASVIALSGIARPASFTSLLKSLGARVVSECIYRDHYVFTHADLEDVRKKAIAAKADMIITTEKDAVRLSSLNPEGIHALRVELSVDKPDEWGKMILEHSA
jgi:tetraacyldisaccharide 4'-kinase